MTIYRWEKFEQCAFEKKNELINVSLQSAQYVVVVWWRRILSINMV